MIGSYYISSVSGKGVQQMTWLYEARTYENRSIASYVAMCVRDDQMMMGIREPIVQIFRTKKGKYAVRYRLSGR
ncbi:hypothetical protein DNHGIG_37940 [Collibacillus ludicampi]|uniref:Uncharacterized protein n=2 Tax=Collibacillus ludicampi TaxID=2771369 RepID=A0AAV4LK63_9BACL|nr:hypothetical protein DNHGIG_37940 [Collibacillus ludicampi]